VVFLADGRIVGELARSEPERIAERMAHLGEW
jgi:putative ABC transport system ATP-binding protein